MITSEGTIEIDVDEFFRFVDDNHNPYDGGEILYGVPTYNHDNSTIEINYAYGSVSNPRTWAVKSKALKEWEDKTNE